MVNALARSNPISIMFLMAASKVSPVRRSFESEEFELEGGTGKSDGGAPEGAADGAGAAVATLSGFVAQGSD